MKKKIINDMQLEIDSLTGGMGECYSDLFSMQQSLALITARSRSNNEYYEEYIKAVIYLTKNHYFENVKLKDEFLRTAIEDVPHVRQQSTTYDLNALYIATFYKKYMEDYKEEDEEEEECQCECDCKKKKKSGIKVKDILDNLDEYPKATVYDVYCLYKAYKKKDREICRYNGTAD